MSRYQNEEWDKSDPDEKISRVSSRSSIASGTGFSSARLMPEKDHSPSVSSNSLFAEEPEDDLFSSQPKPPPENIVR